MMNPKVTVISTDQYGAYLDHNELAREKPKRFKTCNQMEADLKDSIMAAMEANAIPLKVTVQYTKYDSDQYALYSLMSCTGYYLTYEYMGQV